MKKLFIALAIALILVPGISLAATMQAASSEEGSLTVSTQAKNVYLAGNAVNFAGKTAEDFVAVGNTISVAGDVNGSLMVAGNTVTVSGPVGQSARVAGANITIQNSVGSDLMAAGASVVVDKNSVIGDDLYVASGTLDLFGTVNGNVYATGSKININGTVNGSVIIKDAETVILGDKAIVGGDLNYSSSKLANINPEAKIGGETNFNMLAVPKADKNLIFGLISTFSIMMILGSFFVLWLVIAILPKMMTKFVEDSLVDRWKKIGIAFIALVVAPIAAVTLMISVIGLPVGLLLMGVYSLILGFAKLVAPIFIGSYLFALLSKDKKIKVTWLTVLIGVLASGFIMLVPFVGNAVLFIVFLMSLGQIVLCINNWFKSNK
jgi:hypothetical protein